MVFRPAAFLTLLGLVGFVACARKHENPSCWQHFGECLDRNEPPLDVTNRVKPRENRNVVKTVQNIFSLEQCLSKDVLKDCYLVGFNLGTTCQRLANACVLYRECTQFDTRCGKACPTGRRLVQDFSLDYYTVLAGGTLDERYKYADKGEVLDNTGKSCGQYDFGFPTKNSEGAAGVHVKKGNNNQQDYLLMCGGYNKDDGYRTACEGMARGADWADRTETLVVGRAFHSMVAIKDKAFTFGGYNDVAGMLDSIEVYDGTAWAESTVKLTSPRSHTCAVYIKSNGKDSIYVLGGWDNTLDYIPDIIKYDWDGTDLVEDTTFSVELPPDREGVSAGRSDMACSHYRWEGWKDGIMIVGGYRASGAWLNTAWFLDLTIAFNASDSTFPWIRLYDISQNFDGGRHYHGISYKGTQPMIVGGWNNLNMQSLLMFDECKGDDLTRAGKWVFDRRKAMSKGREKFVTISAPSYMIPTNKRCL